MDRYSRKSRLQRSMLATALVSCLAITVPAYAQTATATLRGTVVGAEAGAQVTATNVQTGSTRATQTSADGSYSLVGLPPGTYTVRSGGSEQTVTLTVASTSTLNLQADTGVAETAPAGEAIDLDTVTVTAPVLRDVKNSEVGNTVSLRQIQQLPQATRNFLEFADTVPGMAFEMDDQGKTTLRGGATNSSSGNLYIDGVGQKSYVKAGGIAGQSDTQGNPFSQLAIGEYKVITSNYKAEYGQVTGAAVTAATRSGTNEFEGEAFYRFTNQSLREKRPSEEAPGRDKSDSQTKEWGAAFGGPIIKDKMHFFFAYEKKDNVVPRVVLADPNVANYVQYLPPEVQAQYGTVTQPFEEDLYFGKIDWDISENDRVELSAQVRDETQVDGIGGLAAADHGRDFINKDKRGTLRWLHYADAWTNELTATAEDSRYSPYPMGIGNGILYLVVDRPGSPNTEPTLIQTGPSSGFDAQNKTQKGWSIADNLTFNSFTWHGDHTIKVGASYKDIELRSVDALAINPQFSYNVTTDGVDPTPIKVRFTAPFNTVGQSNDVKSDAKQYGFFIQDDWAVNDKLTLNIGVRWDYEKNPAYTNFVTAPDFVAALYSDDPANPGQPWANRLLASGIDVANFISTGNNRSDFKDAWAPRFGFSYDLNGDEQHVIHGGAGRSYDRNLFEQMSLEVSKAALSPVEVNFINPETGQCYRPDNGRPCIEWDPVYLNGPEALSEIPLTTGSRETFMLSNDFKTPYSDQFSLGMSNQVGDWLTDVTLQHILSHDGLVYSLLNRYPDGNFYNASGDAPWGQPVPGYANTIVGYNGIETRNTQLLLSADKPYTKASGWGMSIAYTQSHARQNRNINEIYAFDRARIEQYPFVRSDAVPRHRLVVAGSMDGFWGITFGAKIVLETPESGNTIACWGQRNPDNSKCTPIGFTYPGTGKFLVGGDIWGYRTVDFQATKDFKFGDRYSAYARLNLLNAFNFKNNSSFIYDSGSSFGSGGIFNNNPDIGVNKYGDMRYVPRTITVEVGAKF